MVTGSLNQTAAAEIRAEMGRQQLTHRELARRLDWNHVSLGRRLKGTSPLSLDELDHIAAALNVPMQQLLGPATGQEER